METKKASKSTWKHVICCLILLVIFMLTVGMHINAEGNADGVIADSSDTVPLRASSLRRLALLSYAEKNEVEFFTKSYYSSGRERHGGAGECKEESVWTNMVIRVDGVLSANVPVAAMRWSRRLPFAPTAADLWRLTISLIPGAASLTA